MISRIAAANMPTASLAPGFIVRCCLILLLSILAAKAGSFIFSRNSGSSVSSFPFLRTTSMPASIPTRQEGIHTFMISTDAVEVASTVAMVAVAALMGLPVSDR